MEGGGAFCVKMVKIFKKKRLTCGGGLSESRTFKGRNGMKQAMKTILASAAVLWVCAASAEAFPSWMGVYGTVARHTGANPGQFTILMNEDYFGLEANVGIRVNGGDWAEHAMAYQTNLSGNSVWAYTPAEPFPFGAAVEFYFHGFEGASNIYDSANSANYHSGPLFWSAPADTGLVSAYPGNGYGKTRVCVLGEDLIGAHSYGVLSMARKPAGSAWEALAYPLEDAGIVDFGLAGNGGALLVACLTSSNVIVRTSADGGGTFSGALEAVAPPASGSLAGLGVAAGGAAGEFGIVYGVATNCCGAQQLYFIRSTDGGATWSAPVTALSSGDGGAYFSWLELGRNNDGWFLAARNVWQGSSLIMVCARSTNGTDWTAESLGGNRAWSEPDLCLATNRAMLAADPYFDDYIRTWRYQGGTWTTQDVARALESGRGVKLGTDGLGKWFLFRQVDNNAGWLWGSFQSLDDGYTWTTNRALPNPQVMNASDSFAVEQALNIGAKQFLLWHADYYIGTYQRMHQALWQASDGYEERMDDLQWAGSAFTVVITNVAPGATNHLEGSASIVAPVWTNIATWRGGEPATNYVGTASTQGYFRIRTER